MLYESQLKAINLSVENDFSSGIHCHATGTGKSWIAFEILLEYAKKYPNDNVMWICEQKTVLEQQFNERRLKRDGHDKVLQSFNIIDLVKRKLPDWPKKANSIGKNLLIVTNRSFLVSKERYTALTVPINLIIHDECHSVGNKTTATFYNWIFNNSSITPRCIGFSATPNPELFPYDRILTHYSIYDAFCDNIILPPRIHWISSEHRLSDEDVMIMCFDLIQDLSHQKLVVWAGTIQACESLAVLWGDYFDNFKICIDTSVESETSRKFESFSEFEQLENKGILFCAAKHREGSDIKNLDCCIFLDRVENRSPKTFVQCIGRVLRHDENKLKKYGLVIDLKASSCLKLTDRMNYYLNSGDTFPWVYNYEPVSLEDRHIVLHTLELVQSTTPPTKTHDFTVSDLISKFVMECPSDEEYVTRLDYELNVISDNHLASHIMKAVEILELTGKIPHVTRGSCGSSLVCFLLGIGNIDPVKYGIRFERFANQYRTNLPDIDIDFPHNLRDEVFLKLQLTWPNKVARISNHVLWHQKSATREAIRRAGNHKMIPKEALASYIKNLSPEKRNEINTIQKELQNTFRHYSLHCGGIVFFPEGIPKDIIMKNQHKTISQIVYDKRDVAKTMAFKVDILSSRGISQAIGVFGEQIDFSDCPFDEKTYKLLQNGDNIGITFAESPLMRKALTKIQPKSIKDLAVCLALIRPAANEARNYDDDSITSEDMKDYLVFDDDAIDIIASVLNIPHDRADLYRRCIDKGKWDKTVHAEYKADIKKADTAKLIYIDRAMASIKRYSFCKSHSYSYAQLVYKLAYAKAHHPKEFWISTLKHCRRSYRKWVHLYEARLNGIDVIANLMREKDCSTFARNRHSSFDEQSFEDQLRNFGYWNMISQEFPKGSYFYARDKEYFFCGIIASIRMYDDVIDTCICVGLNHGRPKYIQIITPKVYTPPNVIILKGRGSLRTGLTESFDCYTSHKFKFL